LEKENAYMHHRFHRAMALVAMALVATAALALYPATPALAQNEDNRQTKTPIKHHHSKV
jgi:hypothetical protein